MRKNRKPLISLTDAITLYNFSPVPRPVFTEKGHCQWCNEKIQGTRKKSFCCKEHSDDFHRLVTWGRTRSGYSNHIVWRDKLTCQDCGDILAVKNVFGIYIPLENGAEVHHIIPVEEGGTDDPRNLITLCHKCHKERHVKLKQYKDVKISMLDDAYYKAFAPDEAGRDIIYINGEKIKGNWLTGNFLEESETTFCCKEDYLSYPDNTKYYICYDQMTDWGLPNSHIKKEIIRETLCRPTLQQDKDGKLVFENDIMKNYSLGITGAVKFGHHKAPNKDFGTVGFYVRPIPDDGSKNLPIELEFWLTHCRKAGTIFDKENA